MNILKGDNKQDLDFSRLLLASRAQNVKRWHTIDTIKTPTVGAHSARVMEILIYLGGALFKPITKELLMYALRHDYAESYLGDIPRRVSTEEIKTLISKKEEEWLKCNGFEVSLLAFEKELFIIADKMEALLFCMQELAMGNNSIDRIIKGIFIYFDERDETQKEHPLDVGFIIEQLKKEYKNIKKGLYKAEL